MSLKYQKITGTNDLLPPEIYMWQYMEDSARKLFHTFCFQEIRTPVIENTELFVRSVGQETDIVEKEMYTFVDKDEKSVSLRPEETAGVVRAYLENGLYSLQSLNKLYYIGPMFRRERPQQGRYRQFHQIGAEVIGSSLPCIDAENIIWLIEYFKILKVKDIILHLNSSGCSKCKPGYILALKEKLDPKIKSMCPDCQRRYKRNIFRLLDCKQDSCKAIISELPVIADYMCSECSTHFDELKKLLDSEGIAYHLNPHLVRGIDYYTKTVFEFIHKGLGSQNTVAAGGRYDMLVQDMGGIPTGAFGFSIGEERLAMLLEKTEGIVFPRPKINVYLVSLDDDSYKRNLKLLYQLRRVGIISEIDYEQKSLKAQMRSANKLSADYVVLRGSNEMQEGVVTLKDMQNGTEEKISENAIESLLLKKINSIH